MDSLVHRRRGGALAYLYKLQPWDAAEKLRQMIPSKLERPPRGRTRASARERDSWHENKFQLVPAGIGPDYIARGFPFCIIENWNRIPANFSTYGFDIATLQSFKCKVNNFLRSQSTPLRGEATCFVLAGARSLASYTCNRVDSQMAKQSPNSETKSTQ